jgi:hypothetical protein
MKIRSHLFESMTLEQVEQYRINLNSIVSGLTLSFSKLS